MSQNVLTKQELERELAKFETDAKTEENEFAVANRDALNHEKDKIAARIPYPNTTPFSVGSDMDEISTIQFEKRKNQPYWEKIKDIQQYIDNGSLYCGHLVLDGIHYYMMDKAGLYSREMGNAKLISVDDREYSDIRRAWRNPKGKKSVELSRNLIMNGWKVEKVDVLADQRSAIADGITDSFLRQALVRNKDNTDLRSIIQSIQNRQDMIRTLPADQTFIVQGCAGSGKTMVLLHRVRYLLHNKDIEKDGYFILVPSFQFKSFIGDLAAEFAISEKRILPFQAYYQILASHGKEIPKDDTNELLFSPEYLKRVYSREFLQECYRELFTVVGNATDLLIRICDESLANEVLNEEAQWEGKEKTVRDNWLNTARQIAKAVEAHIPVDLNCIESIPRFYSQLQMDYFAAEERVREIGPVEIFIEPNDPRVESDARILTYQQKISDEEKQVLSASIFTFSSHKKKLEKIKAEAERARAIVVEEIREGEIKKQDAARKAAADVYPNVTIDAVKNILQEMELLEEKSRKELAEISEKKESLVDHIQEKYLKEIENLNALIELSADISECADRFIGSLEPAIDYFSDLIQRGASLLNGFRKLVSKEKQEKLQLFSDKTDAQREAYLYSLLFNLCKKRIKNEFDIQISKLYKHYWYLNLYCQFLTRSRLWKKYANVFIDEGQDLSASEIELIRKLNSEVDDDGAVVEPTFNIFGDVNQMISLHGIAKWDDAGMDAKMYLLDENFRNPNQIIDYCNSTFPFQMEKIGVDMEPVEEYDSINQYLASCDRVDNKVFIVKDEFDRMDALKELGEIGCSNVAVYTVKQVKGLEFKEVCVVSRDMTMNEQYVAYTRPLKKLVTVTSIKYHSEKSVALYVQGDGTDDK